jgi:probable HAF family extracellular repeat protein
MKKSRLLAAMCVCTTISLLNYSDATSATPDYSLIGVGNNGSNAMAVNNFGQVTGTSPFTNSKATWDAYIWQQSTGMVNLGLYGVSGQDTLGGPYYIDGSSHAYDINDSGQITGYAGGNIRCCADVHIPFVWNLDGSIDVFPAHGIDGWQTGKGNAINDSGQVVGDAQRSVHGLFHEALYWDGGTNISGMGSLGTSTWSEARDINNSGVAVGFSTVDGSRSEAFIWDSINGIQGLGGLTPGYDSTANSLNDSGLVVGSSQYYYMNSQSKTEATLWDGLGGISSLGDLPGGDFISEALAINDDGVVVGWGTTDTGKEASYWDPASTEMFLLADLVDSTISGWTLLEAADISDTGIIVGTGINPDGHLEGFVLTPTAVPLPPALWLFGSALLGLIGMAKKKAA